MHSNVQPTLQVHTQAVSEEKRAANAKMVGQLLPCLNEKVRSKDSRPT